MDCQIYDDVQGPPMTPEMLTRTRVWFDEMVKKGAIKVLTVEGKYGTVTFITNGEVPLDDREGE